MNGKGVEILKKAGLKVEVGLLNREATELNRDFFTFHQKKRPFITLKAALSLDGKISTNREKQTPITEGKSQVFLHLLRHKHQAILVGAGTVFADDPHLGVRLVEGRDPLRIILQGDRELPKKAQVFRDSNILILRNKSVKEVLKNLYEKEVVSVLVEGGNEVFTSFLDEGCVDQLKLFIAPVFLGDEALPFAQIKKTLKLKKTTVEELGQDLLMTALIEQPTHPQIDTEAGRSKDKKLQKKIEVSKARKSKNS